MWNSDTNGLYGDYMASREQGVGAERRDLAKMIEAAATAAAKSEQEGSCLPLTSDETPAAHMGEVASDKALQEEPPCYFGLIRHGSRLDARCDGLDRSQLTTLWPDRDARPYDTPIDEDGLAEESAREMLAAGVRFDRIVSSPFRRCVQTAALVAKALQIRVIDVHYGLGEAMHEVFRSGWPSPDHELTFMAEEEMRSILEAQGVALGDIAGDKPKKGEDAAHRIRTELQRLYRSSYSGRSDDGHKDASSSSLSSSSSSKLLVSHGHSLAQLVELATGETVLQNDFCAYAVFKRGGAPLGAQGSAPLTLAASRGYQSILLT